MTLMVCLAAALTVVATAPAGGQTKPRVDPGQPCCNIVSIDGAAATATAKNAATGQLLTFAVTDKTLLQSLRIGEPIYFNARTRQVSVNNETPCCGLVSMSVSRPVTGILPPYDIKSTNILPPSELKPTKITPPEGLKPANALPPNDLKPTNAFPPEGVAPVDGIRAVDPAYPCCNIVANSALNSHMGRVVVNFPAGAAGMTITDVMRGTEKVDGWMGSGQLVVAPGRYTVVIANRPVTGVVVEGGHDTQVKVGAVRVSGAGNTVVDLLSADGKTKLAGAMGNLTVGVPAGTYMVRMGGVTQKISVSAGKITDF